MRIIDWSSDVCSSDLFGLVADQPAVEGDARVQFRAVGGVEPPHSPAPAKAGDTAPPAVAAMAASPGIGGVDVLQHLLVGRLGHDGADQLLEIGDLGRVTMAGEQVGREDRKSTSLNSSR